MGNSVAGLVRDMWGPGWGDTLPLAPTFLGAPFLPCRGALQGIVTKVPRRDASSQGTGAAAATPSSHQSAALPKTAPAATGGVGPAGHRARLAQLRFGSTSVQHPCPPSAGPCAQIGEGAWPLCPHLPPAPPGPGGQAGLPGFQPPLLTAQVTLASRCLTQPQALSWEMGQPRCPPWSAVRVPQGGADRAGDRAPPPTLSSWLLRPRPGA